MNLPVKISEKDTSQQKQIAVSFVNDMSEAEQLRIKTYCEELLLIKNDGIGKLAKIKKVALVTKNSKAIYPVLKSVYKKLKKYTWDDRDTKSRMGIAGIGIGVTFFAGQGAGIAALGGAVGVPLWVVFGAGGTFAGFIIEEIKRKHKSEGDVIDASYQDVTNNED